jgi:TetR/AcrR family transcriptional repressor of nem operon
MSIDTPEEGTRARIVDLVEALIMERGFNAISYGDVAEQIGIRRASVHYYFPTKADLGLAVIARYIAKLEAAITPVERLPDAASGVAFENFLGTFASVAASAKRVCLGGVLGVEFETLPPAMQAEVRRFYNTAQSWLSALLERGRVAGAFAFAGSGEEVARTIMSTLEGALIIGRALEEPKQVAMAIASVRRLVGLAG